MRFNGSSFFACTDVFSAHDHRLRGLGRFIVACIPLALGLSFMSAAAVLVDSMYFGKLVLLDRTTGIPVTPRHVLATAPQDWVRFTFKGSLTWTMLNNLHYNLDEANLAEHGLHPRYLHLLVNYPILFVNMAWIAMVTVFSKIKAGQWRSESKLVTGTTKPSETPFFFLFHAPMTGLFLTMIASHYYCIYLFFVVVSTRLLRNFRDVITFSHAPSRG